jgi:hypothetical protein
MKLRLFAILVAATFGVGSVTAFAATMGVGSWHIWAGSQTLTKGTCTITSSTQVNDTYVNESSPTSGFGSTATAIVRASTAGNREWMFVSFDLSSCALPTTGGADTATLKLVIKNAPNTARTLAVTPVLAVWTEALTWAQAQALSFGAGPTTSISSGTANGATLSIPVTIDVDSVIKDPTALYGWRISDSGSSSNTTTTFNTVEATASANRPELVINYEK